MTERPANWPPEATPEQIAAHVEKITQRGHPRNNGRLVYVPEGHSIYVYPTEPEACGEDPHDGRSAD